jgi:hypothetical protein
MMKFLSPQDYGMPELFDDIEENPPEFRIAERTGVLTLF